ncbi:hypothetical protein KGM_202864 [Danaus plexippus plexippus]|uniref:Uncharacterized protein n=1 Tax=Danaus plexippus plexippus TaxID=278856 RepID=A0A212F220_DANPL|nr:hypothetical protein KGM_202864 [Danaus plexippus plexippus]
MPAAAVTILRSNRSPCGATFTTRHRSCDPRRGAGPGGGEEAWGRGVTQAIVRQRYRSLTQLAVEDAPVSRSPQPGPESESRTCPRECNLSRVRRIRTRDGVVGVRARHRPDLLHLLS